MCILNEYKHTIYIKLNALHNNVILCFRHSVSLVRDSLCRSMGRRVGGSASFSVCVCVHCVIWHIYICLHTYIYSILYQSVYVLSKCRGQRRAANIAVLTLHTLSVGCIVYCICVCTIRSLLAAACTHSVLVVAIHIFYIRYNINIYISYGGGMHTAHSKHILPLRLSHNTGIYTCIRA